VETPWCESDRHGLTSKLSIVLCLSVNRRDISNRSQQTMMLTRQPGLKSDPAFVRELNTVLRAYRCLDFRLPALNGGKAPKAIRLSARCTMYSNAEVHRWLADPLHTRFHRAASASMLLVTPPRCAEVCNQLQTYASAINCSGIFLETPHSASQPLR
jgi:hypothetical protein